MKRQKGHRTGKSPGGQRLPSPPPRDSEKGTDRATLPWQRDWFLSLLLVVAVLIVYQPALRGQFIWDDDSWVIRISNLLQSGSGLLAIWCEPAALQQYYPLTGTTFWLDYHLWGLWPLPYHVENILLHVLAALLFGRVLQQFRIPGARLAAAIFALHPVMVESAGWITERKNVLSLAFYLGALLVYARSVWRPDRPPPAVDFRPWKSSGYWLAFALFLCALLAKTTAVSLPAVILLIGWWQRGRIQWRRDVLPMLPFFTLAIGLGLVTAWLEKNHVGAHGADFALTFPERCLIAGRAFWFYLGKLFWPANLCFVYPRWQPDAGLWWQWLYPAAALGLLLGLWQARARIGRGPAAALFFFVGTLFPVLGFLNAYFMRYSFVCDHWVYLSSLGLIALVGAGLMRLAAALRLPAMGRGFAVLMLLALAALTRQQAGMYADNETLWRTAVARNPACWMGYDNLSDLMLHRGQVEEAISCSRQALALNPHDEIACVGMGNALLRQGQVDQAATQYQEALTLSPDSAIAHYNLANILFQKGELNDAIVHYQAALKTDPDSGPVHNNLGSALLQVGQVNEAIRHGQKALTIQPDDTSTHNNLGNAFRQAGRVEEAMVQYQRALALQPDSASTHNNLGNLLFEKGQTDEAIDHYQKALAIRPDFADAHNNLAIALLGKGRPGEAVGHWRAAVQINPRYQLPLKNLAWVLATCSDGSVRNGAEAVALALRAQQLAGGTDPVILQTLAAAYAENGQFAEAVATAQQARQLIPEPDRALADALREQLGFYQRNLPFRDARAAEVPVSSGPP